MAHDVIVSGVQSWDATQVRIQLRMENVECDTTGLEG